MYDICCIGHITLDKVVTPESEVHMPGGTAFYFSNAVCNMDIHYRLVTAVAETEMHFVTDLRKKNIEVSVLNSTHTVYFENIYPENRDHRTQRVLQKANAFTAGQLDGVQSKIFHLGPLLADDIPIELIKELSKRGLVSLDVQGYLREVHNENVHAIDWPAKKEILPYIHILKANESEMEKLTGEKDAGTAAKILAGWGVKEVVITLGSLGSVLYADHIFYDIPAFKPASIVDATGCGDTYMAGYLYQRIKGTPLQYAGEFAAAMATCKIGSSGPFTGTAKEIEQIMKSGSPA